MFMLNKHAMAQNYLKFFYYIFVLQTFKIQFSFMSGSVIGRNNEDTVYCGFEKKKTLWHNKLPKRKKKFPTCATKRSQYI
jgi:hypothetical protein